MSNTFPYATFEPNKQHTYIEVNGNTATNTPIISKMSYTEYKFIKELEDLLHFCKLLGSLKHKILANKIEKKLKELKNYV